MAGSALTESAPLANAGVRFPPPLLFVSGIAAGWAIDRFVHPLPIPLAAGTAFVLGVALTAAGLGLMAWGILTFRAAKTAILPHRSASGIVTHGPYRFTRNPMYVGMTVVYLGLSLLVRSVWPLLLLPVVIAMLVHLVIRREEAYLVSAFRDEYDAYRGRVRRWL